MEKRATITDVARLAGVSKVTVSYVLNGRSKEFRISSETEQRIRSAADSLSYRPNGLATRLASKQTFTIGVVFQFADFFSSTGGFIDEVMRGVCAAAVSEGFDLMLHTRPVATPELEADVLSDGRIDGVLLLRDQGDPIHGALIARHVPVVEFFTTSELEGAYTVDVDNVQGGILATSHLASLGHRRIGMICGPAGSSPAAGRFVGFQQALGQHGIPFNPDYCITCGNSAEVRERLPELLLRKDRPTALFAWSDDSALAALDVARHLEMWIPDELSVVGFDSLDLCDSSVPPLSSVRQPIYEMAREATKLLASIIRKEAPPIRQVRFPLSLDIRGSTAPAPVQPLAKEVTT